MATKIKLLYDISLQISASQKAGLYRVADELFCRLAAHPEIEIYPCVGTTKAVPRAYLSDCGLRICWSGRSLCRTCASP